MAKISAVVPMWWDRDVDEHGRPLRADVRQAAHQLWPEALRRVRKTISDPGEAAGLIEISIVRISHHLDHAKTSPFAPNIPSLLSLHFSQELNRLARKLDRIQLLGDETRIEEFAATSGWAERIDGHLDFQKIIAYLRPQTRTLIVMRLEQHSWKVIGAKLGKSPGFLRKAFWKDLRAVLPRMDKLKRRGRTKIQKLTPRRIEVKLPPQAFPSDVESGEAEVIKGFYKWVHQNHPNPQRTGCPGKLALADLVVAESNFGDEYTLKHIGQCAACVDDLTELRLEFERMGKMSE